ncbi:MAG: hypothetical protein KIS94_15010 [Chitinophagales bacterium]|nr:hypothetical protein [Chitinophagales bacterium]
MEREKWIDETLTVADAIGRVEARATLFAGIKSRIKTEGIVPLRVVWLAAASLVLLVALNWLILSETAGSDSSNSSAVPSYSFTETSFNLY